MKLVRTFLMKGQMQHFEAALSRFLLLIGRPWRSSDGIRLDWHYMWMSRNEEPPTECSWSIWVFGAKGDEVARQAAIKAYEQGDGVRVDFVDGYYCYGDLERAHIGTPFDEFSRKFGEIAGLLPDPVTEAATEKPMSESGPWGVIADEREREMVRLWCENMTNSEIADELHRLGLTKERLVPITITKRLSELRRSYGREVVPLDKDRRVS